MKHYTQLTQADFDTIKQLHALGLKKQQIHEITKRANSTIALITQSDTLEGYKELVRAMLAKKEANKKASQSEGVDTAEQEAIGSIAPQATPNNDTLERIAVALERLANAWEKTPEKKGWLK